MKDLFRRLTERRANDSLESRLRHEAMQGSPLRLLRLSQERALDQVTLGILARRGNHAVRMNVARHENLTDQTASRLTRIVDSSFQEALRARFWPDLGTKVPDSVPPPPSPATPDSHSGPYASLGGTNDPACDDIGQSAGDTTAPGLGTQRGTTDASGEPFGEEGPTAAGGLEPNIVGDDVRQSSTGSEIGMRQGPGAEVGEDRTNDDIGEEDSTTTAFVGDAAPPDAMGLDEVVDQAFDLAEAMRLSPSQQSFDEPKASWPRSEDVSEIRLRAILERLPRGNAGEELLNRLSGREGAPSLRRLFELREEGWEADEITLIWRIRDAWNACHDVGPREWPLDYQTVARLVGAFAGYPTVEEVLHVLDLLAERWRCRHHQDRISRNGYIHRWVRRYEAAWRNGYDVPVDVLLCA